MQTHFWAKTLPDGSAGISVQNHCVNVGAVAEVLIAQLPPSVRSLLPPGSATIAALHDVGKITLGFQAKCREWLTLEGLPSFSLGEVALSVTDHALVSQVALQRVLEPPSARLWAVAVGAHHGRPKGRVARIAGIEAHSEWAEEHRGALVREMCRLFGALPAVPPETRLAPHHTDLWLLAGLITVADWIGSNEAWFSPARGLPLDGAREAARHAVAQIGWPGGRLKAVDFGAAFTSPRLPGFTPNALQEAVAGAARAPGIVIVEGPMGCGKTEAALFAALQLVASGENHGIYFALPTQVTSNRIHKRVEIFLRNTLADDAPLRLAHGNAWLEDDFDLRLRPAFGGGNEDGADEQNESIREARSWFASAKQALLAPYGVGTIDQALQGVVAVKHFPVRRFALAGKVVILDEVHSYDVYTGTLITALIRELIDLRCTVIILSATLTGDRRRELLAAAGVQESCPPDAYPMVTAGTGGTCLHSTPGWVTRPSVSLRCAVIPDDEAVDELIRRAEAGQHVLWIRNTVAEAQEAFRLATGKARQGAVEVGILHSRFPFKCRSHVEGDWLERLGKNRPLDGPGSILVATQVVEQSVDIDLDFIISDLAPTDMLLQRMGRLWRHERPRRAASAPEFWVRRPELPDDADAPALKKSLGRSARVYAPYVLLRTQAIWRLQAEVRLPADIRPLLEATYTKPDEMEPDAWRALHAELEETKTALVANAEAATRVLGSPVLADKDKVLTRRKGPPTKPVVLLRSITDNPGGLTTLVSLDNSSVEIGSNEWQRSHARFLQEWLVRIPRWMVPADTPRPPWLDLHGPPGATVAVVRDDGRCLFGEELSTVIFDPRLGIYAEQNSQLSPTRRKDDDDEFDY
jgi:CRISPR-associated endonuclease/helicase Cas3